LKNSKKQKILIIGAGYVGLSNAIIFKDYYDVYIYDSNKTKIDLIRENKSPLNCLEFINFFDDQAPDFKVLDELNNLSNFKFCIICISTNYINKENKFDDKNIINLIIQILKHNNKIHFVIRSTISVGFCSQLIQKINYDRISFVPEFLRENSAIDDSLKPNRFVIGSLPRYFKKLVDLFHVVIKSDVPVIRCDHTTAESIKLFSNAYLALRVAFFNEVDSFALSYQLDSYNLISGISLDTRIGNFYNNPSFGYGGYCLPKDIQQINSEFKKINLNSIFKSVHLSNNYRAKFLCNYILNKGINNIGIYRLNMKVSSGNIRNSATIKLLKLILDIKPSVKLFIYEPIISNLNEIKIKGNILLVNNLELLNKNVDIIIANRIDKEIKKFRNKIFSRDLFGIS